MAEGACRAASDAAAEVVRFCSELIAIDTTNTGDPETSVGEHEAALYVADRIVEIGLEPEVLEPRATRTSVVTRVPGRDTARPALLVHGHLDVVPAVPEEWSVPPFSGLVRDGWIWGRGAVDMKGMDAMMLAVLRAWTRDGVRPERDVVFAWVADEEAGGTWGARWLCDHRGDLFDGCTEAIGEVGGFSVPLRPGRQIYPIMTAEKGRSTLQITARGRSGHGALGADTNPIETLAGALVRLAARESESHLTGPVRQFLDRVGELLGDDLSSLPLELAVERLGYLGLLIKAATRNTATPTAVRAGYKSNVVPGSARADVDCRTLPGHRSSFEREVGALLGDEVELVWTAVNEALESPYDCPLVAKMSAALTKFDPSAAIVPYMNPAGTDAQSFQRLGMSTYGFSPLALPVGTNFGALFHGTDERVPIAGLEFGVGVLDTFLRSA